MNVRRLHADEASLPGGKTEADYREEYERYPTHLRRNTGKVGHQQDDRRHRKAQHRTNFAGMNDVSFQETGDAIDVMVIKTDVVITEQIDLGAGYTTCFEVVLDPF